MPNATLQVTGAVGWRREGLVYKKNEVIFYLSTFPLLWKGCAPLSFWNDNEMWQVPREKKGVT